MTPKEMRVWSSGSWAISKVLMIAAAEICERLDKLIAQGEGREKGDLHRFTCPNCESHSFWIDDAPAYCDRVGCGWSGPYAEHVRDVEGQSGRPQPPQAKDVTEGKSPPKRAKEQR